MTARQFRNVVPCRRPQLLIDSRTARGPYRGTKKQGRDRVFESLYAVQG